MSEGQEREPITLFLAAGSLGLGVWWSSDGRPDLGIAWFAVALAALATWYVRGRPGRTPWWARSVRLADVRSWLRRA